MAGWLTSWGAILTSLIFTGELGFFPSCPLTLDALFWSTPPLLLSLSFPFGFITLLILAVDLSFSNNEMENILVEYLMLIMCLVSRKQTTTFLPSEEVFWMTRWQLPDVISLEVLGSTIYCYAWNDGYYCYKYYYAEEASLQAQTAALFTNIINEVIFNINSSAPAFLKTVYGLGYRAICNFYSTSMMGLPPRVISFGRDLVYFMNDKNKPLLVADEEWFMSSKHRPTRR